MDLFYDAIDDSIIYDTSKIKIFDGIAGSGKTTYLSKKFEKDGVDYLHCTSTNRLKKDIEARFPDRNVKTCASGLFRSNKIGFYTLPTEPDTKTIIIDEILQTSGAVIKWAIDHVGVYNIFICTDQKQTLSPEQDKYIFKKYIELLANEKSVIIQPTVTHRPRTKETENFYYKSFRDSSEEGFKLFSKLKKEFPIIRYSQLPEDFTENAAYITHTNEIEQRIYDRYNLQARYDLPLIPKGMISSKDPKNKTNYPILPQIKTKSSVMLGYWQVENVGSVIRYQGSEVEQGQKLYYLANKDSHPTDREIYTMITRMKDINSLVIVDCPKPEKTEIFSFNDIPILKPVMKTVLSSDTYRVDKNGKVNVSGEEVKALNGDEITLPIYHQLVAKLAKDIKEDEVITSLIYKGKLVNTTTIINKKSDDYKKPKLSFLSILQKDQYLKCESMDEILFICDSLKTGYPTYPSRVRNEQLKQIKDFRYGIDLAGSYPIALKFGDIPNGSTFRREMDGVCKTGIFVKDGYYKKGTVIMTPLYEYLIKKGERENIKDIGSFDKMESTYIGEKFYNAYHKSIEDKQDAKAAAKWGILERHYLEKTKKGDKEVYYKNTNNVYEPVMWAIKSYESCTIEKIRDIIYGDGFFRRGIQLVDCLYFETKEELDYIGTMILWRIPNIEFRIFKYDSTISKTSNQEVIFKNYEDLKSRDEIKTERKKTYNKEYQKKYQKQYSQRGYHKKADN